MATFLPLSMNIYRCLKEQCGCSVRWTDGWMEREKEKALEVMLN